jgi:hypothetical protein
MLLPVGGEAAQAISQVFASKPIVGKGGTTVGTSVSLNNRKAMAAELGLTGKANAEKLNAAILERQDLAFRHIKSEIAGLNGEFTLHKVANRLLASGERQITVVVREVVRKHGPTDEAMAESLGLTVDEVKQLRAAKEKAAQPVEMEASATE